MKMTQQTYQILETAISQILRKHSNSGQEYYAKGLSARRYCFDVFYAATSKASGLLPGDDGRYYWVNDNCYTKGLDDSHIYTALKKILQAQLRIWPTS